MRIVGINGSPTVQGHTETAVRAVLAAAEAAGAQVEVLQLAGAEGPARAVHAVLDSAFGIDGFVIGSPVYRASFATPLKAFLDSLPRGMGRDTAAPLVGRATVIVATGGSWHHFLALDDLRSVLGGFFATHVVPPGLYASLEAFRESGELLPEFQRLAESQGRALVELADLLSRSRELRSLKPQV